MEAARKHAEAMEAQWRASRPNAPLGLRLTRTAAKLDKAIGIQQRNLREWDAFEADVLAKRNRLAKRSAEDAERVALHKQALDALNREMAGGGGEVEGDSVVIPAVKSAALAVEGLGGVLPVLREVLAALPADSSHRRALEQARADTEAVEALLRNNRVPAQCQRTENAGLEQYDIAEQDGEYHEEFGDYDDMEDVGGDDLDDSWADDAGQNSEQAHSHSWTSRWRHAGGGSWGSGSWQRTTAWGGDDGRQQQDGDHGSTPPSAPATSPPSSHHTATAPQPPTPHPPSAPPTAATDPPLATAHREAIGLDGEQKQRLAASYSSEDAAAAQELHARTTAMAEQQRAREHESTVRDIFQKAKDKGVQVDYEWLRTMSMQQLDGWVYNNLG